jgi:glycosyltransferase involved in cell wall biosynthesis
VRAIIKAEHSTGEIGMGWGRRSFEKLFVPFTDCFIAVAEGQVEFLVTEKAIPEEKIVVVYNGIDLTKFSPGPKRADWLEILDIPAEAKVVGILAVLRPEKDHANLFRAATRVIEERPDTFLVIAGDGPERGHLENLAEDLGIRGHVRFAGHVADVEGILSTFDVAVLCSYTVETLPMAFIEAMAMKKPLVATRVGGLPEMIEEGRNGYLVPKKNSPALAEAILKVIESDQKIERMGEHSRWLAERRFSASLMTSATESLIENMVCTDRQSADH